MAPDVTGIPSTTANVALDSRVAQAAAVCDRLLGAFGRRIVGQRILAERLMMALIADGHVLLEGLPGLAKTTAVKTLAEITGLHARRIQFTPDLLPADVIGTQVFNPRSGDFNVKKGPIFSNLLLADEINRAPAKVQSALLEAMQERQVTIGDTTFKLDPPFLVLATQNPIEQEGTYPLPEAQLDRFLFKVLVGYPTFEQETEIVRRIADQGHEAIEPVAKAEDIDAMRSLARSIAIADKVRNYIVNLVFATREPERYGLAELKGKIRYGASPRASIDLDRAARAMAVLRGRSYVTPQDVKDVGLDVMRHRIVLSYEAEADGMTTEVAIKRVLDRVEVP